MRKKDKLIQEAFEVYQSGRKENTDHTDDFYSEGFEDKIFYCIEKMHIKNPRFKARIISIGIVMILLFCLALGCFIYYRGQSSIRTTQRMEELWEEAYQSGGVGGVKMRYIYTEEPGTDRYNGVMCEYQTIVLNYEQREQFEKYDIAYHKTSKELLCSPADLLGATCGTELMSGTGLMIDYRTVYQLSDRSSEEFLILKDESGDMVSLAKYVGVSSSLINPMMLYSKDICQNIFGIQSIEDIRSITLERYQERNKENTEKLLAVYTDSKSQEQFLSCFQKENKIHMYSENFGNLVQEGEENSADDLVEESTESVQWMEGTAGKTWEEITKEMPEKCYFLVFENIWKENWVMGLLVEEDAVQIYIDTGITNEIHFFRLDTDDQKWLSNLIAEADKVY